MKQMCCICGKELPNRWAVMGRCKKKGCDMPFCALHWRNGNKLCREHGWSEPKNIEQGILKVEGDSPDNQQPATNNLEREPKGADMNEEQNMDLSKVPEKQGKKAMAEALKAAKAVGAGAKALVAKMKYARSPQAMQDTLSENLDKNQERREEVSKKLEEVHNRIVALKKQYEAAPAARKSTLQMELKSLMGEYKSLEREFKVLLENEQVLGTVKGRFMETLAYDMRVISEKHIDKIADGIEDRVDDAEGALDAVDDLEKAGRRRDRDDGDFDFDAELAAFGDEEIVMEPEEAVSTEPEEEEKKKDASEELPEAE